MQNSTGKIIFILGGCRSGKSRHALELGRQIAGQKRIFVATCQAQDEEMQKRIEMHQAQRDPAWETLEIPLQLADAVTAHSKKETVILIDCLTLWISNLLMADPSMESVREALQGLIRALQNAAGPVILVSNEVGGGIVPEYEIGRLFRDAVGFVNQKVAACADTVVWMVAGIPVTVKKAGKQVA